MLVVVHHGDVEFFFQARFDFETFRRLDIFQIDSSEGGRDGFHRLDKLLRIFFINFDVEHVDAGKNFKQQAFAFHDRLSGKRANVAEAQDCGAVGNYGHQIAFRRIFICIVRILFNLQAGFSHSGRVSQ